MRRFKLPVILLAATVLLSACGTAGDREDQASESERIDIDYVSQVESLYEQSDVWEYYEEMLPADVDPEDVSSVTYAVMDLDADGLLEVITEVNLMTYDDDREWVTFNTYNMIFELGDDGSIHTINTADSEDMGFFGGLNIRHAMLTGHYDGKIPVFHISDDNGNTSRSGEEGYWSFLMRYGTLYIDNDTVVIDYTCMTMYDGSWEDPVITYYDAEGNEISEEEYSELNSQFHSGTSFMTAAGRFSEISEEAMRTSYEIFMGIYEPQETRSPEAVETDN